MTERIQDLVIGAGAIGVNCAHALAAAGRDVVLIERGSVCSGCSYGNMGWVTPCHSLPIPGPGLVAQTLKWMLRGDSPLYIKPSLRPSLLAWLWRFYRHCDPAAAARGLAAMAALNQHVVPMTRALVDRYGLDCEFEERGVMYVFQTEAGLSKGRKELEQLGEYDIPGEVLTREEVLAREPNVRDDIYGGIHYPGEADFIPDRFVKRLADRLPGLGVRMLTETLIENLATSGSRVRTVRTSAETFEPENVVLAAGAWTVPMARRLGIRLSMQPAKGYSVTLKSQPGTPTCPINLSELKVAITPWQNTIRLGGTMELAGFQLKINQRRVDAILRAAKTCLPNFRADDIQEVWTGMRPVTSDGLPIIGRSGLLNNVILATGHAMLGLTQSVMTGLLVADLITGEPSLVPLAPFSPDRF